MLKKWVIATITHPAPHLYLLDNQCEYSTVNTEAACSVCATWHG